jgi:hypothetical protein
MLSRYKLTANAETAISPDKPLPVFTSALETAPGNDVYSDSLFLSGHYSRESKSGIAISDAVTQAQSRDENIKKAATNKDRFSSLASIYRKLRPNRQEKLKKKARKKKQSEEESPYPLEPSFQM